MRPISSGSLGASENLLSLFEMIRMHRNDAVYPSVGSVTRLKVFLSIRNTREAQHRLSRLTDWFALQSGASE